MFFSLLDAGLGFTKWANPASLSMSVVACIEKGIDVVADATATHHLIVVLTAVLEIVPITGVEYQHHESGESHEDAPGQPFGLLTCTHCSSILSLRVAHPQGWGLERTKERNPHH